MLAALVLVASARLEHLNRIDDACTELDFVLVVLVIAVDRPGQVIPLGRIVSVAHARNVLIPEPLPHLGCLIVINTCPVIAAELRAEPRFYQIPDMVSVYYEG
jgi:hypothetical protein